MKVLLVEDDALLGDGVKTGLSLSGFEVEWLRDGASALEAARQDAFDLMVLDLGLPLMDGLSVLRTLRESGSTLATLILTARDGVGDRVAGLDAGADDYLVKPFALEELAARLRALYRRPPTRPQNCLVHGELSLDSDSRQVIWRGEVISLPRREFNLLELLLQHRGRIFSREALEQRLYGWDDLIASNAVEVHIHALRQHFGKELIRTVRGQGYLIAAP